VRKTLHELLCATIVGNCAAACNPALPIKNNSKNFFMIFVFCGKEKKFKNRQSEIDRSLYIGLEKV
jgi:hypothetical protein